MKKVKLIKKKEFVIVVLNLKYEIFIIYIIYFINFNINNSINNKIYIFL